MTSKGAAILLWCLLVTCHTTAISSYQLPNDKINALLDLLEIWISILYCCHFYHSLGRFGVSNGQVLDLLGYFLTNQYPSILNPSNSWVFFCYFGLVDKKRKRKFEISKVWSLELTSFWWTHSVHSAKNLKSGLVWMFKILINFVCNKVRILTHFSWTCWTLRKRQ